MKSLVIVISIHHDSTIKIASAIAKVLNAQIKNPRDVKPEELENYDLVGFGSGIYDAKHHGSLLKLADNLPQVSNKKVFLFSTAGVSNENKAINDHSKLRGKLELKGYKIVDNFQCKGFNTNSFLKYFGGMNKDRPNVEDLKNAEKFAENLKQME
jgi:flavodoxin